MIYVIKCSMFSTKSFIVSCLTFRFLIHFEFIFVYGVRKCSNFIFEHVAVLSSFSTPFIEEAVFAPIVCSCLLCQKQDSHGSLVYSCAFYLVPLVYISVFVPVPYYLHDCSTVVQSEVRKVDSSSSILLSQDCFGYLESLVFLNCEMFVLIL